MKNDMNLVKKMAESLIYKFKENDIPLERILDIYDVNDLDDIFNDGGEVRCESFIDLAYDEALNYYKFESDEFLNFGYEHAKLALSMIWMGFNLFKKY